MSVAPRRALCLIHGLACAPADWDPLIAFLGRSHRCLAPDLGFFASDAADRPAPSVASLARRVTVELQVLRTPSVLVGHSLGCRVALELCRQRPDKVLGLVLIDSSYFHGIDPAALKARILADPSGFVQDTFGQMMGPRMPEEIAERLVARAKCMPASAMAGLFADLVRWDQQESRAALEACRELPLLAIQSTTVGADGRRRLLAAAEATPWTELVASLVPAAQVAVLPEIGHFPMIEVPEAVAGLIEPFLGAIGG